MSMNQPSIIKSYLECIDLAIGQGITLDMTSSSFVLRGMNRSDLGFLTIQEVEAFLDGRASMLLEGVRHNG